MSLKASITSTASFRSRSLQAEHWRLGLMAASVGIIAAMWIIRRVMGGAVASADAAFYPVMGILCAGMVLFIVGFFTSASMSAGSPMWRRLASASTIVNLGVPLACLLVLQQHSPRGAYAALSGPSLLMLPIIVTLSVLRLKPLFSLLIGLMAAAGHWALAARAVALEHLEYHVWPAVFSYGALLALLGVAAAVLARFVRTYIQEAVSEAEAAERSGRALAGMEHELDIAKSIQLGLLPSGPPTVPTFDIAGMARPAAKAGGDYYDWQALPDGRLVVAIADVTGHGIGPALVMAVCRAYARATAPGSATSSEFMRRMNGLILGDIKGERFITMAIALVSENGDVELLSAGHGPTFLYRKADQSVTQFGGNGLPLGIMENEEFNPADFLHLDPGDVLVLLTDGFMEHPSPDGELFGIERLSHVIAEHASSTAEELIASIDRAVAAHAAGTPQNDDMTAVVLRRQ